MKGVFITGVTGHVGSRLAAEYLKAEGYRVYVHVRAPSQERAHARVKEALSFWGVAPQLIEERIEVLRGDLTADDLGISLIEREKLTKELQLIVHAAGDIRLTSSLEEARSVNVGGLSNVVRLARECRGLERLGFVSTLEIVGDYEEIVYEEFLSDIPRRFLNTYEQAKSEAEEFLRNEIEEGLSVSIFRPGMVVGQAVDGRVPKFQSFYLMIEKMLLKPDFPILPHGCVVDTIPVDVLSEGIVKLMEHPSAAQRIFHFGQGLKDRTGFYELLDKVQPLAEEKLGRRIRRPWYVSPLPYRFVLRVLSQLTFGRLNKFVRIQLVFIEFMALDWKFDRSNTETMLGELGMRLPKFDDYLPKLLEYYLPRRKENRLPF